MKIIVNRTALLDIVNTARLAVPGRTPKPVLLCVLLRAESDRLEVSGTSLDQYIKASTSLVQIEEAGVSAVDAEKLSQIINESTDDTMEIRSDGGSMQILTSDAKFKLFEQRAQDFPPEPKILDPVVRHIGAGQLRSLFDRVQHAVAKEATRYTFNGVLLTMKGSNVEVVATDGRRLAKASAQAEHSDKSVSVVVPISAVKDFLSADVDPESTVSVEASENHATFVTESVRISTNLLEGQFPPYEDIIPQNCDRVATLPRESFQHAMRQAALMTSEDSKGVRMSFTSTGLSMYAVSAGSGDATVRVPCKYAGPDIEIGFNPKYISDSVSACGSDDVTLSMSEPNRPGKIEGSNTICVLMPVNLLQ